MNPVHVLLKMEYEELRACRVCLSTETKLFNIYEIGLLDTFSDVSGAPISPMDGMPQHLCALCYAQFRKCQAFKNRCRNAQLYLQGAANPITTAFLRNLDTVHLKLPLSISKLDPITLPEDLNENITEVKEECNDVDFHHEENDKTEPQFDEIGFVDEKFDDMDIDSDASLDERLIDVKNKSDKEKLFIKTEETDKDNNKKYKKKKLTKKQKDKSEKERKALKKKLLKQSKECTDDKKKVFYEFLLDEFVNKNQKNSIKTCDIDILQYLENQNLLEVPDSNFPKENDLDPIIEAFHSYVNDKNINDNNVNNRNPKRKSKDVKDSKVKQKVTKKKDKRYKDEDDMISFAKMYNFDLTFLNTREEQYAELAVRKQSLKYRKGKYRCDYCFFGFQTENVFKNHMAVHDPSTGEHVCDVCTTRFQRHTELLEHQRRHHLYKYTCRECGKCVPYSALAKQHYDFHKGIKYECEHCGKKYSKYSSRLDHIRIHHATTVCEICYETFQGPLGLRSHKTKVHKETALCGGCNRHFDSREALDRHTEGIGNTCDTRLAPCTKCGYNLTSSEALNSHIAQYHSKVKSGAEQGYTTKKRVVRNRVIYCECVTPNDPEKIDGVDSTQPTVDQDNRCERCGLPRKKRKPKKFLCEICADRMFTSEAALKYHQRIHTGERPYQCPMCPKRFRVKENLHNHVNTHTGERPYKCPHCPKAFRTNTANHRHQLVHTKKRPYRCEICDKTFQTSTYLKIHVRTVHMKIPMPPRIRNRKRHIE